MSGSNRPVVLLVDDHADTLEMYSHMLAGSGFDVVAADNAATALAQASSRPPSAVITDMWMPGSVTALDLCRHFTALGIPVVVLTGVGPGHEHAAAREAGCASLVMKPFGPDALVTEIRRIIRVSPSSQSH